MIIACQSPREWDREGPGGPRACYREHHPLSGTDFSTAVLASGTIIGNNKFPITFYGSICSNRHMLKLWLNYSLNS